MREDQFRDRLNDALGEPPALRTPELRRPPAPRSFSGAMAVVAAGLAIVLIVVLVGSRVVLRPQRGVGPNAAQPSPVATPLATPPAADSFPCVLPVFVTVETRDSLTNEVGFLNVPSGEFRVDRQATVADLPHPPGSGPSFYSTSLKRWLPATPDSVSPDETQYAYVAVSGKTSALHVVDARTRTDRLLWTYGSGMGVSAWDATGLVVMTVPFAGGTATTWLVDPATGEVSRHANTPFPDLLPFSIASPGEAFSPMGHDGHGQTVFRLGSRDVGTRYRVIVVEGGKVTATIYSGVNGDARHFDPETATFDAHGIWLSDFEAKRVWLWSPRAGLRGFPVTGLPTVPANNRYDSVSYFLKGGCAPGPQPA